MAGPSDEFSEFEHEGWQRVASRYEDTWSGLTLGFVEPLLDSVDPAPGKRLLDVACGPGYVALAAKARGAETVGLDFSSEMVGFAREAHPEMNFMEGDAQALEFEDWSFDIVVMNFGALHLSEPERAFAEARRVLKPGGRYGFTVWAGPEYSPGAKLMEEAVQAHARPVDTLPQGPDYFGYGDREVSRQILQDLAFDATTHTFETVMHEFNVPSATFLFEAERDVAVRTGALLAAQSEEIRDAIQAQVEKNVQQFARGDGYAVPFAAHIVAIQAPAEGG